jgi:hypothetical protein
MKELILENPPRGLRTFGKKTRKARKVRTGKKRRSAKQRAATRKMLSAARKTFGSRKAKRSARKASRRARKSTRRVSRKSSKSRTSTARKHTNKMARKSRRKASRKVSRRRKAHTYLIRSKGSPIKLNGMIGSVFNKENLTVAGGAVAATVITNIALGSSFASKLPGVGSPYTRALYNVMLPALGAFAVKKFSPSLAKGLVIGGLANGVAQLVTASGVGPAGITANVQIANAPVGKVGEYLGEYLGASTNDSSESFGAFSDNAWSE